MAAEELGLRIQGPEELDRLALDFRRGADAFAVHGQGRDIQILEMGPEPIVDEAIEWSGVQALQDATDGALTRGQESARLGTATGTQAAELILIQGLGELADVQQGVVARDHRGGGDGDDGGDATMAPTFVAAGVLEFFQGLEQALGLAPAQRILARGGLSPVRGPSGRHDRGRKDLTRLGVERHNKDRLGLLVELVEVQVRATEALGYADFRPIRRVLTGAFKTLGVHIGFDRQDRMVVVRLPIFTEASKVAA